MCRALRQRGLDLTVATTSHELGDDLSNGHKDRQHGNPSPELHSGTQEFGGVPTHFFPVQWGDSFKYSRPLATWLNAHVCDFDVVHIHAVFNHACVAAARACRRQQVPYVIRPLGTLDPWSMNQKPVRKRFFWALAGRKMLRMASAVHYTAEAERTATEQLLGLDKGKVIPLGVESSAPVDVASSGAIVGTNRPYVLVLSRIHAKKGLEVLIEAFLELRQEAVYSDWQLVIAGDGEPAYVESLKQEVTKRRANEAVVFRGWIEGEQKHAILQNASLLALPSHQENFGLCVFEALMEGVPVLISPQVNLAEDIVQANAGWICAVDVTSLATCLKGALANEEERVKRGSAGKKFAEKYEWSKIAKQLETMYQSVVETSRR
jgi:glycosyltransferase involved in cell wall biosynthesis